MQLKWDQGLASRGRLKGQKTFASADSDAAQASAKPIKTPRLNHVEFVNCSEDLQMPATESSRKRKRQASLPTRPRARCKRISNKAIPEDVVCKTSNNVLTLQIPMPVPDLLADPQNRQLFDYYVNHVSVITVITDSNQNPFRHILPRLAFESPLIMSNILAIASANLANTHPDHALTQNTFHHLSQVHTLLQDRLQNPELCLSEITLAAILGQVSYQLHHGSVSHWRIHLTAARGIVNALGGPKKLLQLPVTAVNGGLGSTPNAHWKFYVQHLAWLDILAATTSDSKRIGSAAYWTALIDATQNPKRIKAHDVDARDNQHLQEEGEIYGMSDLMGCSEEILGIIAEMTRRYDDFCSTPDQPAANDLLPTSFANASQRAGLSKRQTSPEAHVQELRQLETYYITKLDALAPNQKPATPGEALQELFRLSARIYLHYRILHTPCYSLTVQSLLSQAIALLPLIPTPSSQEYGLPWPLFILGSVSIYSLQQKVVQARYERIARHMGFGNQRRCLELLQEVWTGWREAERTCRAREAGSAWEEKDLGRRRWEVVMREKNWELLLA